jgi:cupin 2 domain-containing protein
LLTLAALVLMSGNSKCLPMTPENLLDGIPAELTEELFTTIHRAKGVRMERIVSRGHCSPPGFWYDQDEHEWVIVLAGSAAIQFEDDPEPVQLQQGSYLSIPAHARHRVAWTSPNERTVWLAIHYGD